LIQLSDTISTIPAANRYTGTEELTATGTLVGYGMTGTGSTGAIDLDGMRRAGQNEIDQLFRTRGKTPNVIAYDFDSGSEDDNVFGPKDPLPYEYLTSFGDSGGPTFIGDSSLLAGVHSFVVDENRDGLWCNYGDWAGDTRVSAFNKWIDEIIGGGDNGKDNGKPDKDKPPRGPRGKSTLADVALGRPALAYAVPEPTSLAVLVLGGLALIRRRRA